MDEVRLIFILKEKNRNESFDVQTRKCKDVGVNSGSC